MAETEEDKARERTTPVLRYTPYLRMWTSMSLPPPSHRVAPRRIGLAPLSMLDVDPPTFVDVAADAGFDFVGLRVRAVTSAETPFDLSVGSPLLAATQDRLAARNLTCVDAEFVLLNGQTGADDWRPALESAAALGAASMTVAINDPDDARMVDDLGALVADARVVGVACTIEPISYNLLNSLPRAQELARQAGCQVLIDTLHLTRFGATGAEVAAVADLVPLIQLCDGPTIRPADRDALVAESRSNRLAPGDGDFPLASYLTNLPPDLPVSLEVPSIHLRQNRSPLEFARYLRQRALAVLAATTRATSNSATPEGERS